MNIGLIKKVRIALAEDPRTVGDYRLTVSEHMKGRAHPFPFAALSPSRIRKRCIFNARLT